MSWLSPGLGQPLQATNDPAGKSKQNRWLEEKTRRRSRSGRPGTDVFLLMPLVYSEEEFFSGPSINSYGGFWEYTLLRQLGSIPKNIGLSPLQETGLWIKSSVCILVTELNLGYCDGAFRANFNTGFAAKAFIHVNRF